MNIHRVEDLLEVARSSGRRWVVSVAAPYEGSVLRAVARAVELGFVEARLVGRPDTIAQTAQQEGVALGAGLTVLPADDEAETIRVATDSVHSGRAQVLLKGHVSTAALFRAVLDRQVGLKADGLLSHVAVFNEPATGRLMLLTDAGINIAPNVHRKVQIVRNAVQVAHQLGIARPRVALLAAVDVVNYPAMPATLDAALVARVARSGAVPDAVVEGPFALDNAVSAAAAQKKQRRGEVAGQADILCAPEIETANVLYKALQTFCGATLAGAVVGARSPLAVPSRSDSPASKLMSIALACVLAP